MMQGSSQTTTGRSPAAECLSAAMDGAIERSAGGDGLPARFDAQARQDWALYHLIGDALRSEELAMSPASGARIAAAVAARLENEPALVAPMPTPAVPERATAAAGVGGWWSARRRVVPSFAAAAAAATLAWVVLPSMHGARPMTTQIASLTPAAGNWQQVNLSADHDLDPYLEAHQQFASDHGGIGYAAAYAGPVGR